MFGAGVGAFGCFVVLSSAVTTSFLIFSFHLLKFQRKILCITGILTGVFL